MSGTKIGGQKAAVTNKKIHGEDFYAKIGRLGGSVSCAGGFASEKKGKDGLTGPERARIAGGKGGLLSRRGPALRDNEGYAVNKNGERYVVGRPRKNTTKSEPESKPEPKKSFIKKIFGSK